jgi:hypothetical protein
LELAATIIQQYGYASFINGCKQNLHTYADNTLVVAWQGFGSVTTNGSTTYLLLLQALHQHFHQYHPTFSYIPGPIQCHG